VHHGVVESTWRKGRIKEAGPEASVQLRNLTVVEHTSKQLDGQVLWFEVG
jgi:hypothetical protein